MKDVAFNNMASNNSSTFVRGSSANLRKLGEANTLLFDLDDTMAVYRAAFVQKCLYLTIKDHIYAIPDKDAVEQSVLLHQNMHDGGKQKRVLAGMINPTDTRSFWEGFSDYLHRDIQPEDVSFDPSLVRLINFAARNNINVGVISNSTPTAGGRVLSILDDRTGIDLRNSASFLGTGTNRKPKADALQAYQEETGQFVDAGHSAYVGNAVSDLLFARNTGMVPVLIDYTDSSRDISETPQGAQLISDSVVTGCFSALKNHIERMRPHYRRPVSFSVEKALTTGNERCVNRKDITLEPSDETMYHIVNDATSEVMSYVPEIWQSFHDRFSGSDEFSVADIDGYAQLISEASGAYALPPIDSINNPNIRSYYTQNRVRKEGNYVFGRGAAYYRQYIPELKGNFSAQLDMVEGEIRDAIDTLESSVPSSEAEHLAVLGVEDNLRGNFLATYLSAINVMRDDPLSTNIDTIIRLSEQLRSGYQRALELQYSHMLGLPYDRHELIRAIREEVSVLAEYRQVYSNASIHPKFKSPEIDDPLVIAARANYLCDQYPETDSLVGLTSGGVELSEVARLLYGVRGKLVSSVHYPISVHNGQTMWSKDKTPGGNQTAIDQIIDIESLAGKHVVVCEDNSNSGQTLARVVDRINSYDAASVHFAVVEIDPTRIIMHFVQQKAGAKHHIGEAADRVRPIANYHHPDFRGAVRIVKMVPQDNSMTKLIAQDTANRGII